jgi:methylmalonyl-CoA/ethylmalonyl-CoA epimerase
MIKSPAVTKIDHIGLLVNNLYQTIEIFCNILGVDHSKVLLKAEERQFEDWFKVAFIPVGESYIEIIEPGKTNGVLARRLKAQGPGLHHIAFSVSEDRYTELFYDLKQKGFRLLDKNPEDRVIAGKQWTFIHPKSTRGVLVELVTEHGEDALKYIGLTPMQERKFKD